MKLMLSPLFTWIILLLSSSACLADSPALATTCSYFTRDRAANAPLDVARYYAGYLDLDHLIFCSNSFTFEIDHLSEMKSFRGHAYYEIFYLPPPKGKNASLHSVIDITNDGIYFCAYKNECGNYGDKGFIITSGMSRLQIVKFLEGWRNLNITTVNELLKQSTKNGAIHEIPANTDLRLLEIVGRGRNEALLIFQSKSSSQKLRAEGILKHRALKIKSIELSPSQQRKLRRSMLKNIIDDNLYEEGLRLTQFPMMISELKSFG